MLAVAYVVQQPIARPMANELSATHMHGSPARPHAGPAPPSGGPPAPRSEESRVWDELDGRLAVLDEALSRIRKLAPAEARPGDETVAPCDFQVVASSEWSSSPVGEFLDLDGISGSYGTEAGKGLSGF